MQLDFGVVETPHATLFAPFVGKKTPPQGEVSQRNPHNRSRS